MFTLEPVIDDQLVPLISGVRFCYFEKPVSFKLTTTVTDHPLYVDIMASRPSDRPDGEIILGPIKDGRVSLTLYHPPIGNAATSAVRQHLIFVGDKQLTVQFLLLCFKELSHFVLYYEFYEEALAAPSFKQMPASETKS